MITYDQHCNMYYLFHSGRLLQVVWLYTMWGKNHGFCDLHFFFFLFLHQYIKKDIWYVSVNFPIKPWSFRIYWICCAALNLCYITLFISYFCHLQGHMFIAENHPDTEVLNHNVVTHKTCSLGRNGVCQWNMEVHMRKCNGDLLYAFPWFDNQNTDTWSQHICFGKIFKPV